jgi:arylsulfatase A-like enzyme
MKIIVMKNLLAILILFAVAAGLKSFANNADAAENKPNILFIAIDDLRSELGCYGKKHIKTPNIDRLAANAVLFEHANCMVPVCGASRSALFSGIRPKHNRFVDVSAMVSRETPDAVPLNSHFKNNGYITLNNGKMYHNRHDSDDGWSEPAWRSKLPDYVLPESLDALEKDRQYQLSVQKNNVKNKKISPWGPAWESADVPDNSYGDGETIEKSIEDLRLLAKSGKPFFLAVGLFKPHAPFVAPKKYWDLYRREDIQLPENFRYIPENAPAESLHEYKGFQSFTNIPKGSEPISDELAKELIHAYYACVSYADANTGKLLDELDNLGITGNTLVVLWGDHGWHLGEHTQWSKHSLYENVVNAPLLIKLPGQKEGRRVSEPVEFIDIYLTLNELAGLPEPKKDQLQGQSLVPLLEGKKSLQKRYAVGRYVEGDTIFDGRFRYSEYRDNKGSGKIVSRMLYDHKVDPP